ncbi:glycosyltransferase family 4 protein [Formosa sp. A9]|uniref:glycosyltransferase family 4 protein n=1 Tax=Formosa sp. A9 TaxID=3442641 RepID=UPI003EB8C6BC
MTKRIRILFTTTNFNTAGSGKVIYDLISGLDRSKFEIEIACRHNKGAFFKEVKNLGLPIHIFDTRTAYKPYFNLLYRIQTVVYFYKRNKYDIVHSWHWSSDWTEVLAARLAGVPYIYTKKAMSWGNVHWKLKSYLANFIITINDEMRDYFPYKQSQTLIPLGIDTDFYSPHGIEDLRQDTNGFTIITVANLVPVKGIEVLLQAVKRLDDGFRLWVVGDASNDYGQAMQQLSKDLGLEHRVAFLGRQLDVRPYIAQADVYVIPTLDEGRKEGMPMALVEAMSMGIPVLGSNISGINYVLRDFKDLLFEAGNVTALRDHLVNIKQKDLVNRKELGLQLRTYCLKHYKKTTFIEAHEALYNNVLKK